MRVVRVVRYISELRTIIASIAHSLRSLFFTILLIAFLIYILGVFLTQLITEHIAGSNDEVATEELRQYFGSVPGSCLVLFQTMTSGIDWENVSTPLSEHISPVMAMVYSAYVAFTVFAMMNVITGVFVESALASDAEEKDAHMVSQLLSFLSKENLTEPGKLTIDEFLDRLTDPAMNLYFKSVDLDPSEALGLFRLMDTDENGHVEAEEFVLGCLRLRGKAKAIDLATLTYESRRAFRRFEVHLNKIRKTMDINTADTNSVQLPLGKAQLIHCDEFPPSSTHVCDLPGSIEMEC
jgi:hypothetical protein